MPDTAIHQVNDYCEKMGMAEDSPLRQLFLLSWKQMEATQEAAAAAKEAVKGGARGLTPEGEKDLISRMVSAASASIENEAESIVHLMNLGFALKIAMALLFALLIGAGVGYWYGVERISAANQTIATILEAGPRTADQWITLMRNNDLHGSLSQCQGKTLHIIDGRKACDVPLWIEDGKTTP